MSLRVKPLNGASFLPGAHHPHCKRHGEHLLWIQGRPFCLGCSCMYGGILGGTSLSPLAPWESSGFTLWLVIHLCAIAPTAIQPWYQRKAFKIASRFALGVASASYFLSGWRIQQGALPTWGFVLLMAAVFGSFAVALLSLRRRFTLDPCDSCPHGTYPTCDWNLPRLLATNPADDVLVRAAADLERGSVVARDLPLVTRGSRLATKPLDLELHAGGRVLRSASQGAERAKQEQEAHDGETKESLPRAERGLA